MLKTKEKVESFSNADNLVYTLYSEEKNWGEEEVKEFGNYLANYLVEDNRGSFTLQIAKKREKRYSLHKVKVYLEGEQGEGKIFYNLVDNTYRRHISFNSELEAKEELTLLLFNL